MSILKRFKGFLARPSIKQRAEVELEEAWNDLMDAETGADYASSVITYNKNRIARLQALLNSSNKE